MLSALAVRKARLAKAQTHAPPPAAPPTNPPSSSSRRRSSASVPPKSDVNKEPKRWKQLQSINSHLQAKFEAARRARYFAQHIDDESEDAMAVDEQNGVASASHSSSEDGSSLVQPPVIRTGYPRRTRAWSPSVPLPDSSDEEADPTDDTTVPAIPVPSPVDPPPTGPPSVMSTFQPAMDRNVFCLSPEEHDSARRSTVLLLNSTETLALLGTYTVRVLYGSITLAGVTLTSTPHPLPVFAPRSSPIPVIECLPLQSPSSEASVPSGLPPRILPAAKGCDAIICLQESQTGIEGLGKVCRTFNGFFAPSRWHRGQTRFDLALDNVYFLPFRTPDISPLVIPPSWRVAIDHALQHIEDQSDQRPHRHVHLVRGSKNVGKSTFARLVLNCLLYKYRRVAYLDCDLGQSEFTAGGMVNLNIVEHPVFGPPFSHPSIPYMAHYIGATSPRTSPSHYLDSVQALMQIYDMDVQNATLDEDNASETGDGRIGTAIPLVINTMGWTKGLGADISRKIEEIVEPAHVYTFEDPFSEDGGPGPLSTYPPSRSSRFGVPHIHTVTTVPPSSSTSRHTAVDIRTLSMLSYFHAIFPDMPPESPYASPIAYSWDYSSPLLAQPPFDIDCLTAFDKLILTGAGMEDVVPSELHHAFNGAVVGLVNYEQGAGDNTPMATDDPAPSLLPYEQGAAPPSPSTSNCVGLALVRAISPISPTSRPHIQLLTPVPPRLLDSARVLVMGEVQLPIWGMVDFCTLDKDGNIAGYERGKVPYLRWGKGEGAGGERRRVRRNLMRKGQM